MKKLLSCIILSTILASIVNRAYEHYLRPDSLFFSNCLEASKKWAYELRKKDEPCYVFAGGSEVRMSIEPSIMLDKYGVRAINAGVQAGNGIRGNAQTALSFLKKGDTLVLSYLPGSGAGITHTGIHFCYTTDESNTIKKELIPYSFKNLSDLACGSTTNYCIHLMRILTRPHCIYRYTSAQNASITDSGRVEVFLNDEQNKSIISSCKKSVEPNMDGWENLIYEIKEICKNRGVNFIMYMSRGHFHESYRYIHAKQTLYFTELGIPFIKDPYLGCWENSNKYSDTANHLSIEGGIEYSQFLANQLNNRQFWTKSELQQIIASFNKTNM